MNFIKKATTQMRAKVTKYEISQDEEYLELLEKTKKSKKNTHRLERNLKDLAEQMREMGKTMQQTVEYFALEYEPSDPMRQYISQLHQTMERFNSEVVDPFYETMQKKAAVVLKNHATALDGTTKVTESRDKVKYTFDDARYKVNHMLESKKPVDQIKFKNAQQELAQHTSTYNTVAYQCKKELYELLHSKAHNNGVVPFLEAYGLLVSQMSQLFSQFPSMAQSISHIPTYSEKYPDNRETVRPAELTLQPQAGFITNFGLTGQSSTPSPTSVSETSSAPPSSFVPGEFDTEWYYLDADVQQQGPIDFNEMKRLYRAGQLSTSTHVFGGSLADWSPIGGVKGLLPQLSK